MRIIVSSSVSLFVRPSIFFFVPVRFFFPPCVYPSFHSSVHRSLCPSPFFLYLFILLPLTSCLLSYLILHSFLPSLYHSVFFPAIHVSSHFLYHFPSVSYPSFLFLPLHPLLRPFPLSLTACLCLLFSIFSSVNLSLYACSFPSIHLSALSLYRFPSVSYPLFLSPINLSLFSFPFIHFSELFFHHLSSVCLSLIPLSFLPSIYHFSFLSILSSIHFLHHSPPVCLSFLSLSVLYFVNLSLFLPVHSLLCPFLPSLTTFLSVSFPSFLSSINLSLFSFPSIPFSIHFLHHSPPVCLCLISLCPFFRHLSLLPVRPFFLFLHHLPPVCLSFLSLCPLSLSLSVHPLFFFLHLPVCLFSMVSRNGAALQVSVSLCMYLSDPPKK